MILSSDIVQGVSRRTGILILLWSFLASEKVDAPIEWEYFTVLTTLPEPRYETVFPSQVHAINDLIPEEGYLVLARTSGIY
jgi:hypothetical protein